MKKNKATTEIGFINKTNQKNLGRTNKHGTDYIQWFYAMQCQNCNFEYKAMALIFGKGSALIAKGECLELRENKLKIY